MHNLSLSLPSELWEFILDYLDRKSLLQCQHTCHAWRTIVLAYVMSGRLKNRAFVSNLIKVSFFFNVHFSYAHTDVNDKIGAPPIEVPRTR